MTGYFLLSSPTFVMVDRFVLLILWTLIVMPQVVGFLIFFSLIVVLIVQSHQLHWPAKLEGKKRKKVYLLVLYPL